LRPRRRTARSFDPDLPAGAVAAALDSDAFAAYIAAETAQRKKVIDAANIKMEHGRL
jgi:hypothetical protein